MPAVAEVRQIDSMTRAHTSPAAASPVQTSQ
jgi:hypothetical protein